MGGWVGGREGRREGGWEGGREGGREEWEGGREGGRVGGSTVYWERAPSNEISSTTSDPAPLGSGTVHVPLCRFES